MRSSLIASLGLLLLSCGNVHDLTLSAKAIAVVKGHVDVTRIGWLANEHKLFAGIVWGAVPSAHSFCWEFRDELKAQELIKETCPDDFGFFPGEVDAQVELDPLGNGDFEIPLTHLPPAAALVGTNSSHVAYATVIVVADLDGNGRITLRDPNRGRPNDRDQQDGGTELDGGADLDGGTDLDGGFVEEEEEEIPLNVDAPLAASFVTMTDYQERLVFREGDFTGLWIFYPTLACVAPPSGFSVLRTEGLHNPQWCGYSGLDARVRLKTLTEEESLGLVCRAQSVSSRVRQPANDRKPRNLGHAHCIGTDVMVLRSASVCPTLNVQALKACESSVNCEKPEWDMRANPPEWWPCD